MKPLLKWAGGKRWQAPIVDLLYKRRGGRFVEPFCGGMAVALALQPQQALMNDVNAHLINFYRQIKRAPRQALLPVFSVKGGEERFYAIREQFNSLISNGYEGSEVAAELFFILNRTCFNGLCRFNREGKFTTPYGRPNKDINLDRDWKAYAQQFDEWQFQLGDFEDIQLQKGDFVYADPPYDDGFTDYNGGGFSWEDQERCARWMAAHKGPAILVNKATERIAALYRSLGFVIHYLEAPRQISCNGDRTPVKEIFAKRNL